MKHSITGRTIIPRIYDGRWKYIAEKVYVNGQWVKIDYYNISSCIEIMNSFVRIGGAHVVKIILDNSLVA